MSQAQPFDAATLPLHGLRLIEASAGTGKTFSLAGLYLRLIVEENASVRDILVMTFTRAATQETARAHPRPAGRRGTDRVRARTRRRRPPRTRLHAASASQPLRRPRDARPAAGRRRRPRRRGDHRDYPRLRPARCDRKTRFESALAFDRGEPVDDPGIYREAAADYWREHVFGAGDRAIDQANDQTGDQTGDVLALWPSPDALYNDIAPRACPAAHAAGGHRRRASGDAASAAGRDLARHRRTIDHGIC